MPLALWAANTADGADGKTAITLDFDKRVPWWLPYVVLLFAVVALFAVNKVLRNRSEATSTRSRIKRFDKRIAAIQKHCQLLPVNMLDAELERANLSMRPEYHGLNLWFSRSVNKKVKGQLDMLDKCVPMIEKLGYLWKQWSQSRSQMMVEYRARGRLREIGSHMAQEMAYVTSQTDPFSSSVTKGLEAMEDWTDRGELKKKYTDMVAEKCCSLLRYPTTPSDTGTGLESTTDHSAAPLKLLNATPVQMESAPDDGWTAVVKSLWRDSGPGELGALQTALSEWGAACRQDGGQIHVGRIFAANRMVEGELKKPLWSSFQYLELPESDSKNSGNQKDTTVLRDWAGNLKSALANLPAVIKKIDETILSDYGLQLYLRDILREICKTPPDNLSKALAWEQGVYVPLKLMKEGRENRLSEDAMGRLRNKIREKFSSFRDPPHPPAWDDSDLEELFAIVDAAAWTELGERDPKNSKEQRNKLRIVVEAAEEGGGIAEYQLVHCRLDPVDDKEKGFQLRNSHAFNAGFCYEWTIAPTENAEDGCKKKGREIGVQTSHSTETREPQAWIFAPWQGRCQISVTVTRTCDRPQKKGEASIVVEKPVTVEKSGLHKETTRLFWRDAMVLGLAMIAAFGAGLGLEQFEAAKYSSFTAWIILFGSAFGSVKVLEWLDKSED